MKKILTLSASNSSKSINRTLLNLAIKKISGHTVIDADIRDYSMPIYSADLEEAEGSPEAAVKMHELFAQVDAFIIASPEHNGSMPAVFKNLIDWVSRTGDNKNKMFANKPVLLLSTSPGPNGGATNIKTLTQLMPWWGADIKGSYSLGSFYEHYNDDTLSEEKDAELSAVISDFSSGL